MPLVQPCGELGQRSVLSVTGMHGCRDRSEYGASPEFRFR